MSMTNRCQINDGYEVPMVHAEIFDAEYTDSNGDGVENLATVDYRVENVSAFAATRYTLRIMFEGAERTIAATIHGGPLDAGATIAGTAEIDIGALDVHAITARVRGCP